VRQFADLALACVQREYPNKLDHVMADARDVQSPRALHPAFYGCFDWHSAVHGHWLLARLRAPEAERVFDAHFTDENLRVEAAYVAAHPTFERMYGWAWLLALAVELRGTRWTVQPIADVIVRHLHAYLPRLAHPIRVGTHTNTAFALALILDYARAVGDSALDALVTERATTYFAADRDYPAHLEPGGEDFFSPALLEADLMRRVLPAFPRWLAAFLPRVDFTPVVVGDRHDPKLAHLDGLNLSRAWCLRALGYTEQADAHVAAAQVATGDYAGEHWLATFAVYQATT
jgi:Protein of unknown function (DUF2891)